MKLVLAKGVRLGFSLRKAQMSLFGGAPPPKPAEPAPAAKPAPKPAAQAPAPKPAAPAATQPPGAGWMPIAGSRHGGFHRQKAGGGFEYWYPGDAAPRGAPKDMADFALQPQAAGVPKDNSGRVQHHDVGDKVAGAKKERWAQVHSGNLADLEAVGEAAAAKAVTKEAVLGETSGELDKALGDTAGAAYLKQEVRRMISAKPTIAGMDPKKARAAYVEGVEWMREALDKCRTVEDIDELREESKWLADDGAYDEEIPVTVETGRDFERRYGLNGRYGSSVYIYPKGPDGRHIKIPIEGGREGATESLKFILDAHKLQLAGYAVFHGGKKKGASIRKLSVRQKPYSAWFASMGPRMASIFGNGKYSSSTSDTFNQHNSKARQREKADDWTDLLESTTAPKEEGEGGGVRVDVHKEIHARRSGDIERIGGRPVPSQLDGAQLASDFGLRAVQYGNWIDDSKAGKHLEACHGALSDLADVLKVDPKMLAHGSKLAMAFGARGSGWASAHYEPTEKIINLTATRGGGTLAHEWAHFIDHMLPGEDTVPGGFFSGGGATSFGSHGRTGNLHPEAVTAYRAVMHAIHYGDGSHASAPVDFVALDREREELVTQRREIGKMQANARTGAGDPAATAAAIKDYHTRTAEYRRKATAANQTAARPRKISKFLSDAMTLGDYWERPHELFARAFESYAEDKLEEKQRRNTYLVSGTRIPLSLSKTVKGVTVHDLDTYPRKTEREHINKAFDALFEVMNRTGSLRKALRGGTVLPRLQAGARVHLPGGTVVTVGDAR